MNFEFFIPFIPVSNGFLCVLGVLCVRPTLPQLQENDIGNIHEIASARP
jgi:hypothetical protein